MAMVQTSSIKCRVDDTASRFGDTLTTLYHHFALIIILVTVIWSSLIAFWSMVQKNEVTVEDILLLFIYLELGAMVGVYFKTNRMPVRFLIYIAITALTRLLISMVFIDHDPDMRIVIVTGSILLLSIAILILKIGSRQFSSRGLRDVTDFEDDDHSE